MVASPDGACRPVNLLPAPSVRVVSDLAACSHRLSFRVLDRGRGSTRRKDKDHETLTPEQRQQLPAHGIRQQEQRGGSDPYPVVKLFTPDGAATWLLAELDPDDSNIAFGLCDLGMGFPELGCVRLSEL